MRGLSGRTCGSIATMNAVKRTFSTHFQTGRIRSTSKYINWAIMNLRKWIGVWNGRQALFVDVVPPLRLLPSICGTKGTVYLYGGADENGLISNDLWRLSTETRQWSMVHLYILYDVQIRFIKPLPALYGHCCVYYNNSMLVFGGNEVNRRMPLSAWNTELFVASVDLENHNCLFLLFTWYSRYDSSRSLLISSEWRISHYGRTSWVRTTV